MSSAASSDACAHSIADDCGGAPSEMSFVLSDDSENESIFSRSDWWLTLALTAPARSSPDSIAAAWRARAPRFLSSTSPAKAQPLNCDSERRGQLGLYAVPLAPSTTIVLATGTRSRSSKSGLSPLAS